jgi:hypothetical protein
MIAFYLMFDQSRKPKTVNSSKRGFPGLQNEEDEKASVDQAEASVVRDKVANLFASVS